MMSFLRMNGVRIQTVDDFRKHFNFEDAQGLLLQGSLSAWMRNLGESAKADELDDLKNQNYEEEQLREQFARIFSLAPEKVPELPAAAQTEENLPMIIEHQSSLPAVWGRVTPQSFRAAAYVDSPVCLRGNDSAVLVNEKLAMAGISGKTPYDLHRYMRRKLALKIIRDAVAATLPDGIFEDNGYVVELQSDTSLHILDFRDVDRKKLANALKSHFTWGRKDLYFEYLGNLICNYHICTVGEILSYIDSNCDLKSYVDDDAKKLLEEGFGK